MMNARWLALGLAACGGTPPPVAAPPPAPPPDAAAVTADAAAVVTADAAAAATPELVIAPACRGANVVLASREECVVDAKAQELPAGLAISLEPAPLRVRSGATVPAAVALTNTSSDELVLVLDCRHFWSTTYEMHDRTGNRIDIEGRCGPGGGGCGGPSYGFALPPGGVARLAFSLVVRKEDACEGTRTGARIPKGTYQLRVASGLGPVETAIQVR